MLWPEAEFGKLKPSLAVGAVLDKKLAAAKWESIEFVGRYHPRVAPGTHTLNILLLQSTITQSKEFAMSKYDTLLASARRLSVAERLQLIEALGDTLPDESLPPLSDEWIAEIQRRSEEFDRGLVETVPWETVRAEAMRRAGLSEVNDPD